MLNEYYMIAYSSGVKNEYSKQNLSLTIILLDLLMLKVLFQSSCAGNGHDLLKVVCVRLWLTRSDVQRSDVS